MKLLSFTWLKKLLTCLKFLGDDSGAMPPVAPENTRTHGTSGPVNAPTLWLHEDPHIVLLVDYDFEDFPSWVEWDRKAHKLFVVQMGGAAAELALDVPANENMSATGIHRLLLVTGRRERRNSHFVSFIVRD